MHVHINRMCLCYTCYIFLLLWIFLETLFPLVFSLSSSSSNSQHPPTTQRINTDNPTCNLPYFSPSCFLKKHYFSHVTITLTGSTSVLLSLFVFQNMKSYLFPSFLILSPEQSIGKSPSKSIYIHSTHFSLAK